MNYILEDICDFTSGNAWKSEMFSDNGIPIIRINNLNDNSNDFVFWPEKDYDYKYLTSKGDTLISLSGTIKIYRWQGVDGLLNQRIVKIKLKNNYSSIINEDWLYYKLKNSLSLIEQRGKKSTIKNISVSELKKIELLEIPTQEEQNRIVTILDKVESILLNRRSVNVNQSRLLKSIFHNIFKNFFSRETVPLVNYTDIISGITKGKDYKNKTIVEVPYLRVANVQDGYLDLSEIKTISATPVEVEKYSLLYNDLLLTEGGDPDKLGRGFLWRDEIKDCIFQNHLFRVRIIDTNKLSPIFLSYLISSVYGKAYFLKSARQTTGIATINLTHVKNFPVFIPSIELQDSFSKQALKIEKLIAQNNNEIHLLETMLKALSQLAFTGKLKINVAISLESLLQEDYNYFKIHSNKKTIELLLDRLDKNVLNQKKFNDIETYDKAKNFVLQLLKDNKIVQVFDTNKKTVKLAVK